jgi:hypothetical protein
VVLEAVGVQAMGVAVVVAGHISKKFLTMQIYPIRFP